MGNTRRIAFIEQKFVHDTDKTDSGAIIWLLYMVGLHTTKDDQISSNIFTIW